jgi:light-regulated signal transduction histidine kinase (bacteriophytochrome)
MAQILPEPSLELCPGEAVFPIRVSLHKKRISHPDQVFKGRILASSRVGPLAAIINFVIQESISTSNTLPISTERTNNLETVPTPTNIIHDHASGLSSSTAEPVMLAEKQEYANEGHDKHGIIYESSRRFQRCEDEPIQIPGAIQSFGFLIAGTFSGEGKLIVHIASENSEEFCSYSPVDLFMMDNFLDIFVDQHKATFEEKTHFIQSQFMVSSQTSEPVVFFTFIQNRHGVNQPFVCALHLVLQDPPLLVCEFERQVLPQTSARFDLDPSRYRNVNLPNTALDRRAESTNLELKHLSYLLQQDKGSSIETVKIITRIQHQFTACKSLQDLLDCTVGVVQELTDFDRVMVYQFDEENNGKIAAEVTNSDKPVHSYLGLHFPAKDIPPQARKLYQINKFRLLFDREALTARLVYRYKSESMSSIPLDLTHSYLRAMSPIHIKYLENMKVRSTASISLNVDGNLWGLICCHAYGPTGTNIPFALREVCYWVGLCASNCIENLASRARLESRILLNTLHNAHDAESCITLSSSEILRLFHASSGFIVIQGDSRSIGKHSAYREAFTVLQYINSCAFDVVVATQNMAKDYPEFTTALTLKSIAGFLYIPLSKDSDYIIFFRAPQTKEVHWGGNPYETLEADAGSELLQPRSSFKKWTELVTGTCSRWTDIECKE